LFDIAPKGSYSPPTLPPLVELLIPSQKPILSDPITAYPKRMLGDLAEKFRKFKKK
jgi:hypothetical protein